jgi:quercetin dioxygenase-like cupin family protein
MIRFFLGVTTAFVVVGGFFLTSTTALSESQSLIVLQTAPKPAPVVRVKPEELKWVDEPEGLGFKQAAVEGDRTKPGLYIVQVKFPPGVMSKPHFHGETRYATVIKGTWYTGDGDEFTPEKTVPLKPGSYMKHPAGAHHYDGSKDEEVIVELIGMGPSTTTKIHPDEPLFAYSTKKK